jgi:hypothetical protein
LDFSSFSFHFLTTAFKKIKGWIKTTDLRNLAYFYIRLDVSGGKHYTRISGGEETGLS